TATLDVSPGALASIAISPSTATISAGGSQAYTAQGFDSHGNSTGDVTGATTFSISPNGSCDNTVNPPTCGSNIAGTHTVTGTDGSFSDTATLDVTRAGRPAITASPPPNGTVGTTVDVTATPFAGAPDTSIHGAARPCA